MDITTVHLYSYSIPFVHGLLRSGLLINVINDQGISGWGEVAPLPKRSRETLQDCFDQFQFIKQNLIKTDWIEENLFNPISDLKLLPALSFGLESAILSVVDPISPHYIETSALLMGSFDQIRLQAKQRYQEGYTSAKLKVNELSFAEARAVIQELKDQFRLRIDVNRAWKTEEALKFFSQFSLDAFDYVEEPFQNPKDLMRFSHPLAIDESFPEALSLLELERLPNLKALIYKPTVQGGIITGRPLFEWAKKRGIALILSSSFETDLGLAQIASMAYRLSLPDPVGLGTSHYLKEQICEEPIQFFHPKIQIPSNLNPKKSCLMM